MICDQANHGVISEGLAQLPIRELHLRNIVIKRAATPMQVANTEQPRLDQVRINGQLVQVPAQPAGQAIQ